MAAIEMPPKQFWADKVVFEARQELPSLEVCWSTGWVGETFAASVYADAHESSDVVQVSLALNEAHPGLRNHLRISSEAIGVCIDNALAHIDNMRDKLRNPYAPKEIHGSAIGYLSRLMVAHAAGGIKLHGQELAPPLIPVLRQYYRVISQQHEAIHGRIIHEATSKLSPVPLR